VSAPIGAVVRIGPYDWSGPGMPPAQGDYLLSTGGSAYLVLEATATRRPGRYRLRCLKVDEPAPGIRCLPLFWYSRDKKRDR
jgi:hypothetical protein